MSAEAPSETLVAGTTCVVIDCNEWIRLKWLGSPIGRAFMTTLERNKTLVLAIPEVLDSELTKHRAADARALLRRLEDIKAEIDTATGGAVITGMVGLTEEEIEVAIRQRLATASDRIIYPEMTLEQVRGALRRVNGETPPNGPKNQQMKDSLLWEACLTLSEDSRIIFVTSDSGFYLDRQSKKGLARNLAEEPAVSTGRLRVFPSLEEALAVLAPDSVASEAEAEKVDIRELLAVEARWAFHSSHIATDVAAEITDRGVVPHFFRTDTPHVFAVSFTAFFHVNRGTEDRLSGEAAVTGECTLDARTTTVTAVHLERINWTLRDASGKEIKSRELLHEA